ncbi:hypothetical protein ATCC90586_004637 [Pythium insidiosum]|nr:hypothetical protein ATCC90586_004637 [Pythium insidiosum]
MKRTSAHLHRGARDEPTTTPLQRHADVGGVEQLRFRERDGKPSAYTRLYAQGVDLMVHKDQIQQTQAPVLVPVSRRTSSPIVAPNGGADFGMMRRPSVSPIRSDDPQHASYSSASASATSAPRPALHRRDSKVDRLVEQITVLKNSLGLSDEDLQWKVESTKGNAFLAAEKHLTDAEERYDRLVYEIQLLSATPCDEASTVLVKRLKALIQQTALLASLKPSLAACQQDVVRCKRDLTDARIASELRAAKSRGDPDSNETDETVVAQQQCEAAKDRLLQAQEQLKSELERLNQQLVELGGETDTLAKACDSFQFLTAEIADVSTSLLNILRCIPECTGERLVALCEQGIQVAQQLVGSRAGDLKRKEIELSKTIKDIEVWKTRREQSKEFALETAKRDKEWREANAEDNTRCLCLMRSLVPVDVQQLSVEAIIERAASHGVLYTYDLAAYIKQNRLLHWLVTHEVDIARDNFLAIDSAPWFLNFTTYDITELRAVAKVLPETPFDFDKDGKKNDWRRQFMEHIRLLVQQQRGETIKAGWDPARGTRADVPLRPLTDKQQLNPVYRYPTDDEINARIEKYESQQRRLEQKREKLTALETQSIPTAKSEYLATAEDARSEDLQRLVGKAALIELRDKAKHNYQTLCKTRDALRSEIDHGTRQWAAMTPSYDQYLDEVKRIRLLDENVRATRIGGPFPEDVEIRPRERAAFKKLTAEEEAEARRAELSQAIARRDQELNEAPATDTQQSPPGEVSSGSDDSITTTEAVSSKPKDEPSETNQQEPPSHRSSFRRVKSLKVSVEVLRFLQNDFCSPQRAKSNNVLLGAPKTTDGTKADGPAGRQQRASLLRQQSDVTTAKSRREPAPSPNEPPKPKSKAVAALLQREQSCSGADERSESSARPAPAVPNFLAELKKRAGTSASEKPEDSCRAKPPVPNFLEELKKRAAPDDEVRDARATKPAVPSFVAELKKRAAAVNGAAPGATIAQESVETSIETTCASRPEMSFLDELKQVKRSQQRAEDEANGTNVTPPPAPLPPPLRTEPVAPRGFLEELKARQKRADG